MKKSILNTDWNAVHQAIDVIHSLYDDRDCPKYNVTIDANRTVIFDCVNNLELVVNQDGATTLQMAQIAIDEFITKHEPNLLVGMHKSQYKVLIAPSSSDEQKFDNCVNFDQAVEVMYSNDSDGKQICNAVSVHNFNTSEERDCFISGYQSAIGNLGDGYFITNSK